MSLILSVSLAPSAIAGPHYGGTLRFLGETRAMGFDAIKAPRLLGAGRMAGSLIMEKRRPKPRTGGHRAVHFQGMEAR